MNSLRNLLSFLRGGSGFAAVVQTGIATVLVLAVNVATGIVSARALGPQGRGELSALLLCPGVLSYLFTLGLPVSMIVKIKDAPADAPKIMGAVLLLSGCMSLLAVATGALLIPMLLKQYDAHLVNVARALLIFVALGVISTVLVASLQLSDRFVAYNRIRFWQSALTLVGLALLMELHGFTPVTGALAYLVPGLPFLIWMLWSVWHRFKPQFSACRAQVRALLAYGWRVHFVDVAFTLFNQLDKVILVALLAPSVFGVYVVVFNLSRLVTMFGNAASPVLLPRSAGRSIQETLSMTSRALGATTPLASAAVLGFVLLGSFGLRVLYGERFVSGYWTLVILSTEGALASTAIVLQQPYVVLRRPGTLALFHTASLGIGAVFIYLLGRTFGAEGAACGLLLGTMARLTLTHCGFRWVFGVRAPRLVPTRAEVAALLHRTRVRLA